MRRALKRAAPAPSEPPLAPPLPLTPRTVLSRCQKAPRVYCSREATPFVTHHRDPRAPPAVDGVKFCAFSRLFTPFFVWIVAFSILHVFFPQQCAQTQNSKHQIPPGYPNDASDHRTSVLSLRAAVGDCQPNPLLMWPIWHPQPLAAHLAQTTTS